jgi:hypothetical protein
MAFRNANEIAIQMFLQISDDDKLIKVALLIVLFFGFFWWLNRRAKKWLDERGTREEPQNALEWLLGEQQSKPETALRFSEQEFSGNGFEGIGRSS